MIIPGGPDRTKGLVSEYISCLDARRRNQHPRRLSFLLPQTAPLSITDTMAEHQEDITDSKTGAIFPKKDEELYVDADGILEGAKRRSDEEHAMSLMQGLRKYPMACFWSIWFSSALIMEGFDHAFITSFFGFPAFLERYGVLSKSGKYALDPNVQAGISNCVNAGEIIGLLLNGIFADYFGYRIVMIGCLFLMIAFIFLQFFATSIYMYLGAEVLLGIPWGVFQTLTTTYAAEICPTVLRPYLTMIVSLCWSIGYFVGTAALRGFLTMSGEWAYRTPFALQWVFPLPLMIGIYFAPESPWWLIRRGRTQDAEKALRRLRSKNVDEEELANTVSMMVYTARIESEMNSTSSYLELFKGFDLRRTEIVVLIYAIQQLCSSLSSYVVFFLEQAGLASTAAFDFGMGEYALSIVAVFVSWLFIPTWGRRTMLLIGLTFISITTLIIGFIGLAGTTNHTGLAYAVGCILLVQYFVYYTTLGSIVYTVITEIPSNNLRTKSVVIARVVYNMVAIMTGQLVPRMVQTADWNWGARAGLFWGGLQTLGLCWAFFRLPETKNRTFAEIDIIFKNRLGARDFSSAKVDLATQTVELE